MMNIELENRNSTILIAVSAATVVISIAVAIAVVRISAGIMWAAIITASGNAAYMITQGIGVMIHHIYLGKAALQVAQGQAQAARIEAHTRARITSRESYHAVIVRPR